MGELDKSEIFKALTELGMIKEFGEIIPDVFHSTSLKYCLESEGNETQSKIIFRYITETCSTNQNHFEVIMKSLFLILKCSTIGESLINFFKIKEEETKSYELDLK